MNPPKPLPHPRALAHLGDAVYELWVREAAIGYSEKSQELHRYTTLRVKAHTQAVLLDSLLPTLPGDLQALAKRAQNLPVSVNRRSNQTTHRKATALEAVIGFWYLITPEQLPQYRVKILSLLEDLLLSDASR